jgi:hypothetical protein
LLHKAKTSYILKRREYITGYYVRALFFMKPQLVIEVYADKRIPSIAMQGHLPAGD